MQLDGTYKKSKEKKKLNMDWKHKIQKDDLMFIKK